MKFYLCLAFLCLAIAAVALQFDRTLDAKWKQWKSQYRRTYGRKERNHRRAIWEKNLRKIEMHNLEYRAGKSSFRMEMNKFGDMTNEEFRRLMTDFRQNGNQRKTKGSLFHEPLSKKNIETIDWRKKGYVTPVKDEDHCSSSWAFSATGSIEGQWFRKTGKLISLSEQNLIDCAKYGGNVGCRGGITDLAFEYVKNNEGIDSEESYPYEGKNGKCKYDPDKAIAHVTGIVNIPPGQESALKEAVATVGPVSVAIDAAHESFQFYKSGVYYEPECSSQQLNRAALVVGFGVDEDSKKKYWIVKNSWGKAWGNNGYILMSKDKDNNCGIATNASYPEV